MADAFDDADQVFFGEVQSVTPGRRGCLAFSSDQATTAVFTVLDAWKGSTAGQSLSLETAVSGTPCDLDFAVGETWLVYASQGEALRCNRSRNASADDPELSELDAL